MKTVIYARVSTIEQETANQTGVLEAWLKQRGWTAAGTYQENASAWDSGHQKELARLMNDARKGRFQQVAVWSLDRLTRSGAAQMLTLVNTLKSYGVRLVSYQEGWTEASGELAELLYAIIGWIARMESQRRSERTKAGLARTKANGTKLGRPKGTKDKKKRKKREV